MCSHAKTAFPNIQWATAVFLAYLIYHCLYLSNARRRKHRLSKYFDNPVVKVLWQPAHLTCVWLLHLCSTPAWFCSIATHGWLCQDLASGGCLSPLLYHGSLLCLPETIPPKTSSENELWPAVAGRKVSPSSASLWASLGCSCYLSVTQCILFCSGSCWRS